MLDEAQIGFLRNELADIADVNHPGHKFYYEFHSNESSDPSTILFHALGAWRIGPGFHDVLWNPRFLVAASQLLGNVPVRFWHDQLFWKPAKKRRRGGMAPGLLVLDKNKAGCSSHLLVRPGRRDKRKRLPSIHSRQPSLGPVTKAGTCGRYTRHKRFFER